MGQEALRVDLIGIFFPSTLRWTFHSLCVCSYCALQGPKTVSAQSSFASRKDCLGGLAAPTSLLPPIRRGAETEPQAQVIGWQTIWG